MKLNKKKKKKKKKNHDESRSLMKTRASNQKWVSSREVEIQAYELGYRFWRIIPVRPPEKGKTQSLGGNKLDRGLLRVHLHL